MEFLLVALTGVLLVFVAEPVCGNLVTGGMNLKRLSEEIREMDISKDLSLRETIQTANVTICSIMKNEQLYVDEWLQYHKFLGFDHVYLHDNARNASNYLAGLPEKYGDFVQVFHLPGHGVQEAAYMNCLKRGAATSTWAAFLDVDEFIVLRKHANIKDFLHDVAPHGGSVVLNWSVMGSNGSASYDPAPVLTRFTLTSTVPNKHIKTIAYLPHSIHPNIHNCDMRPGYPTVDQHGRNVSDKSPFHFNNDREIANINHYFTKSWDEFKLKRHRGFASNYMKNNLYANESAQSLARIADDYERANADANEVQDTFARDFYLRHLLHK